jgi:hypothetical protein
MSAAVPSRADEYDRSERAGPFDKLAYLFALVGLYVMVGGLFFYGFWHKAVDGDFEIAPPLEEQFDKTIIGTIPGVDVSWVLIDHHPRGPRVLAGTRQPRDDGVQAVQAQAVPAHRSRDGSVGLRSAGIRTDGHRTARVGGDPVRLLRRHGDHHDVRADAAAYTSNRWLG